MSFIRKLLFAFILLLAITSAVTTIFPIGLGKVILGLILPYFIIKILKNNFKFNKVNLYIYIFMFFIFVFVYFHTFFHGSNDYFHSYIFFLNMIEFMFLALIFAHIIQKYMLQDRYIVLKLFVLSALINSIIVYLNIVIPSSRIIIQGVMPVLGNLPPDYLFRTGGFSNGPGASLSIFHSLGAVMSYFLLSNTVSKQKKIFYSLITIVILASTLFISRTGFFLFFIIIGIYTLFFNILKIKLIVKNFIYLTVSVIIFLMLIGISMSIVLNSEQVYLLQERFIPWAFELFISYFENNEVSSKSTSDIFENHIFFPDNESSLLFGEAHYDGIDGEGHYIPSDSGYIRSIFSIGIVGSLITYSYFPIVLFLVKKYFLEDKLYKLLVVVIFSLLIVEIKMPFMYVGKVNLIIYLIIFSEVIYYNSRKKCNVI